MELGILGPQQDLQLLFTQFILSNGFFQVGLKLLKVRLLFLGGKLVFQRDTVLLRLELRRFGPLRLDHQFVLGLQLVLFLGELLEFCFRLRFLRVGFGRLILRLRPDYRDSSEQDEGKKKILH